jgi:glucose/arabinose dehydrogenase
MEFIENELLVIEKNTGMVRHITNNKLLDNPVLDVEVSNYGEHGLLGITSVKDDVYLFFTESYHDGGRALENRIYKYTWNGNELINPILVKRIPSFERTYLGGELVSDLNGKVFAATGDNYKIGLLQNHLKNESFRHFGSILPSDQEGHRTISDSFFKLLPCIKISFHHYTTNPFSWQSEQPDLSENPLELNIFNILGNLDSCFKQFSYENFSDGHWKDTSAIIQIEPEGNYAAIGIRNSFGLGVDPQTGFLWDTENGPDVYDEINLIEDNFNSGWAKIQGPSNGKNLPIITEYDEYVYSEPEFSWEVPVGVTAIEFPNQNDFKKYEDFLFVADTNNGIIYNFKLDETRTKFVFESPHLQDNVLNMLSDSSGNEPMDEIVFAKNLGIITDMKFGPDGALYVISLMEGKIYKIFT